MKTLAITAVLAAVTLGTTPSASAGCHSKGCHRSFHSSYYPRYTPRYYRPAPLPVRPLGPVGGPIGPIGGPVGGPTGPGPLDSDTAGPAAPTVTVPVGATITLPGNRGQALGQVFLVLPQVKLPLAIEAWTTQGVTVTLPEMALQGGMQAQIQVAAPGRAAEMISVTIVPRPQVILGGQQPQVIVEPQSMNTAAATNDAPPAPFRKAETAKSVFGE